jgi:hypothetical protein
MEETDRESSGERNKTELMSDLVSGLLFQFLSGALHTASERHPSLRTPTKLSRC